jgi:D-glycero-D-manno-heptose 1,7-bisphosphate phosphatase
MNTFNIDLSWTLFLDRDGVINHEKHLGYINTWDEFFFYDGVKEAIKIFTGRFNRIVVVTNQKGVGKGITKLKDLQIIHQNMLAEIEKAGGKIDKIYFCPDLDENSPNRKPNAGMALQAKKDFTEIDFTKSIMVGNTLGDMQFGRNIGAVTIFLPTTMPEVSHTDERIDAVYASLLHFAKSL